MLINKKNFSTKILSFMSLLILFGGCDASIESLDDASEAATEQAASGGGVVLIGTATDMAGAGDVLAGKEFRDDSGVLQTGTMNTIGVLNTAVTDTVDGYVSSITNAPVSNVFRDVGTTQISLAEEKSSVGSYPAGYRNVPVVATDDDGFAGSSSIIKANRPSVDCGNTGSISTRIEDCSTQNAGDAIWDGEVNGINGESVWKLVSRINTRETWVDTRTGLLWSDRFTTSDNWCDASGNLEDANGVDCAATGGESYCAEVGNGGGGLDPAIASEDTAGSFNGLYADEKGGMGLQTATQVEWRLPTRNDWLQAEVNGVRFVLRDMTTFFWSSTIVSNFRASAWYFDGQSAFVNVAGGRGSNHAIRCVGRSTWE